ncbi:PREDICTED: cytochrome P450 CYP82D47-like [Ipomoea nil]|uniref:cytochrome P450 CYP82D47-like n=1 Tax=Ipomoea nil TaxID=35883 RepID=UPI0009012A1D|nr:PREDICTED: cytochrome P450 CYP82D47-like [Ipomoea nil]
MQLMTHFTVVVGLLLLALLYVVSWRRRNTTTSGGGTLPPEAAGGWPFIGHLHQLQAPVPLVRTWGAFADKYGPIFTVRLGIPRAVVVSSWEAVRDCFATNDKIFAARPDLCAGKYLAYNFAVFTWATYGPYWRKMRKLSVVELLSNKRLDQLKHIWISELQANIKELYTSIATDDSNNNVDSPTAAKVDMSRWFEQLTLNMIVKIVAGRRYEYRGDDGVEDQEARALKQIFKENMFLAGQIVSGDALSPSWLFRWLDIEGHIKSMKRVAKAKDAIFQDWVNEHVNKKIEKKNPQSLSAGDEARDIIDVMISVIDDKFMDGISFTRDTIIKATIRSMLLDGVDTIAVHLIWVLSEMLNNRHVMKLAQEEIDTKVGTERLVEDSDIENLVYLQAVVKETLRLHPPLPFLVPHEAMEDCTVGGYHIPKGTQLYVNVWRLHRDPEIWSQPEKFLPERFLEADVAANRQFQFIPFGSGRRSCPGMLYAMRVTHLTLARLLQGFNFSTVSNAALDMTEGLGITLPRANPLEVLVTPRLHYVL